MIRNNYAAETVVAWVEGLSVVGVVGFLFYDWRISVVALAIFLVALPARNFIRYGRFFPGAAAVKARAAVKSPLQREMSESLARSAASGQGKTI